MRHDDGVPDARVAGERGLDFAGFDAVAAEFELGVGSAEVFELPVGVSADAVAGAVEAGAVVGVGVG
ncbi:MAG TPA: hypothetical protein VFV01_19400, partial [Spirillospora sp.]|nr:hypothetical protein [Spirillospora sp.]